MGIDNATSKCGEVSRKKIATHILKIRIQKA